VNGPINLAEVRRIHRRFEAAHRRMENQVFREAGEAAIKHVKDSRRPRKRTGKLSTSTSYKLVRGRNRKILKIRNKAKYAAAQERGAGPHVIRARRRKSLRFNVSGGVKFARYVRHPGNPPTRFLWRATHAAFRTAGQRFAAGMSRVAAGF
jgi:hypothetical protein